MPAHSFPTYRYFRDGRSVVVQTQAELDVLEPGHSDSPAGPWPDGRVDDPMGVDWKGPCAPDPVWQQYGYRYGPISRAPSNLVYARAPLIYPDAGERWARSPGELFFLQDRSEDSHLFRARKIEQRQSYTSAVIHPDTDRRFLDDVPLAEYTRRSAAGDTSWFDAFRRPQGSVQEETPRTPRVEAKKLGRIRRSEKPSELLTFIDILKKVVRDYRKAHAGEDPTQEIIAYQWPAPGKSPRSLRNWLNDALPLVGYSAKPVRRALKAWLNDFPDGQEYRTR